MGVERARGREEESQLAHALAIEKAGELHDLAESGQRLGGVAPHEGTDAAEFLVGEIAPAGGRVLIVDGAGADLHAAQADLSDDLLFGSRLRRDAPALAASAHLLADLDEMHADELDPLLGEKPLEHLVGGEAPLHPRGVAADQYHGVADDERDRVGVDVGVVDPRLVRRAGRAGGGDPCPRGYVALEVIHHAQGLGGVDPPPAHHGMEPREGAGDGALRATVGVAREEVGTEENDTVHFPGLVGGRSLREGAHGIAFR